MMKFHQPKKDQCGLCETNRNTPEESRQDTIEQMYQTHQKKKNTVGQLKEELKKEALGKPDSVVASFYFHQVVYTPRSNRCELFCMCRLACYDFTIYNISTHDATCYVWHEGLACRGSNEIATFFVSFAGCSTKYLSIFTSLITPLKAVVGHQKMIIFIMSAKCMTWFWGSASLHIIPTRTSPWTRQ